MAITCRRIWRPASTIWRDAARYYRDALEHDPDNADCWRRAFLYTAASGDVRDAAGAGPTRRGGQARRSRGAAGADRRGHQARRFRCRAHADRAIGAGTVHLADPDPARCLGRARGWARSMPRSRTCKQVPEQGGTEALAHFHTRPDARSGRAQRRSEQGISGGAAGIGPKSARSRGLWPLSGAYGQGRRGQGAFMPSSRTGRAWRPSSPPAQARIAAGKSRERLIRDAQAGRGRSAVRHCRVADRRKQRRHRDPLSAGWGSISRPISIWRRSCSRTVSRRWSKYEDAIAVYDSIDRGFALQDWRRRSRPPSTRRG